jgi:hypothetical protein
LDRKPPYLGVGQEAKLRRDVVTSDESFRVGAHGGHDDHAPLVALEDLGRADTQRFCHAAKTSFQSVSDLK